MIQQGLVAYLLAKPAVIALVEDRIYPQAAPLGRGFPRITYRLVSAPRTHSHQGATGVTTARIQLDCRGTGTQGYHDACVLAEALRVVLDGYRGPMGSFFVQACLMGDVSDDYEPPTDASDVGVDLVSFDLKLAFEESIPTL